MKIMRDGVLAEKEKIAEKKSASGLILYADMFELFDKVKENATFGIVKQIGEDCQYLKEGDRIVYSKGGHTMYLEEDGVKYTFFKEEKNILARCNADGTYDVHPDFVMIKVTKKERDKLYTKKIKRDDGTFVDLVLTVERDKEEEERFTIFVQVGVIHAVGSNVKNVLVGDTAIMNYTVDNLDDIIVGYEGEDKLIVIQANTTYHEKDEIVYANRRTPKDTITAFKGDYDIISSLLGIIRGDELISRAPIVFLEHKSNTISKVSEAGLLYEVTETIFTRQVLSISEESSQKFNVKKGDLVWVNEFDLFNVKIDDKVISAINDLDIMANSDMLKQLHETFANLKSVK